MSRIEWLDLTDSALSSRLEELRVDVPCETLVLNRHALTRVPDFTQYRQFDNLQVLDISGSFSYRGNISVLEPSHIPLNVTDLDLSWNKLSEVGDFSGHSKLNKLDLYENNISVLEPSHIPLSVTDLTLSWNKLSEVGDFSGHSKLNKLDLGGNNISVLEPSHIPLSVTDLNLWSNNLSEVGDFSGHAKLNKLDLVSNNISVLEPSHIPLSVTDLNLSWNKLSEVGDFSQHAHLSTMDMSVNPILTIDGLPNKQFNLQAGTGVRVLGKKCFHKNTYEMLKKLTKRCGWVLQQPPVDVLNQGLEAVMVYFDEKLVRSGQTRMVLLGPTTAGKTSLMESLVAKKSVLVREQDRTWVAVVKEWEISAVDTILIFDQGGHDIYTITSPIFEGQNSIVLLVHDVTKVGDLELDNTAATLRQALQYHPDNQVHTVLTHTDLLDPVAAEKNMDPVKKRLEKTIDEEVRNINMSDTTDEVKQQSILLKKQKEKMKYFLISSKTYKGLDDLKDFLSHIVAEKRVKIPEKWVQLYETMMQQNKPFLKVEDLEKLFHDLHFALEKLLRPSKVADQFISALRYYRDAGHLLFFETVPNLNEFVFPNKEFIIDLLKSCFSHDLGNNIGYRNDPTLQALFVESHVELMLQQYQREGLLDKKLLYFQWQKHKLDVKEMDAFLELLKLFHLCYPIDKDSQLLFFPWFVQNNSPPNGINPNKLSTLDATHFSVELDCQFASRIPVNVFEMMLVQIQKTALDKEYGGERFAWKDGLVVQIGSMECIAIRKQVDSTVSICVRGYTNDLQSIWQVTSDVYTDIKSTLVPFRGVIKKIHFNCNHCRANHITSVKKWLPSDVVPTKPLEVLYQRCHGKDFPSALVIAISANVKNVEQHIKRVEDYLECVHKELSPPDKLLYLDCEEVSEGKFQLSWCWPRCKEERDVFSETVDNTIRHAVVEFRQGDEWQQVTEDVKQSPYTFTGHAEEFRIAAANQNGAGEFIYVTPCHILDADEMISESHGSQMRANHEFFTRMSSVWEIVVRLFSRRAINNHTKESVVRKLGKDNNQRQAADLLMESIYRSTYQQLYLFQKTLRETGHLVMADTLPVRLEQEPGQMVMEDDVPVRLEQEPGQMVMEDGVPVRLEQEPGQMVMEDDVPVRLEQELGQMVMADTLPVRLEHEVLPPQHDDDDPAEPSVEPAILHQEEQHQRESTMLEFESDAQTDNRILTYYRNY